MKKPAQPDEPPPFLRSWRRVYWAIAIYLVLLISVMAIFTKVYNR